MAGQRAGELAMAPKVRVDVDQLRRASRMYNNTVDASMSLGIAPNSFRRLCRKHGVKPRWHKDG